MTNREKLLEAIREQMFLFRDEGEDINAVMQDVAALIGLYIGPDVTVTVQDKPEDLGDVYIKVGLNIGQDDERIETSKQIKEGDIITCNQCDHKFPLTNPIIVCPKCGKETWF